MDGNQGPEVVPAGYGDTGLSRAASGPAAIPGQPGKAAAGLAGMMSAGRPVTDAARIIDRIRELEDEKSAMAAEQARLAVAFDLLQRRAQASQGVPAKDLGAGVGAQIALARRESPAKGGRLLGLAKALVTEMPHTLAALETGQLNEWRATLLVRETACLTAADRAAVDEQLAPDTGAFDGAGDRSLVASARAAAYRLDPRTVTARAAHAAPERYVSLRPAPDTMCHLTALLPIPAGVAVYTALARHADTLRTTGDPRARGQVMADALVERATGTPGGITGVDIQLIITDRTLFQADSEPARLPGYGTVPAEWARTLINNTAGPPGTGGPARSLETGTATATVTAAGHRHGPGVPPGGSSTGGDTSGASADDTAFKVWLRRLYTHPRQRRAHRDGLPRPDLPARTAPAHPDPRRHLPHPLLRRPHPPPGPHHPLAPRRQNHPDQRRRPLRSLQPHQRNPRLDRPPHHRTRTRPTSRPRNQTQAPPRPLGFRRAQTTAHPRTHHPHRPHLPLHSPTPAGNPASPASPGTACIPPTAPTPAPGQDAEARPIQRITCGLGMSRLAATRDRQPSGQG